MDRQTKLDLAQIDKEVRILIAEIGTKAQEQQTRDKMTQEVWSDIHNAAHETALQAHAQIGAQQQQVAQQGHEQDMAAQQQAQQEQAPDQGSGE